MAKLFKRFLDDQSGATAIEYALLATMVALVIIAGSRKMGTTISATFNKVSGNL
ncbi:MAG: Flp family type IVb pilin [Methylocystis sp.]|uniref:Flp family type IVb pilin n=1 Tax=Methylocystis sp. TaxID=1911079 RepID=UPI003DA581AB